MASEPFTVMPVTPADAMLDRAVAFGLNVMPGIDYGWSDYMRDLWARFIDEPPTDLAARAQWHKEQWAECCRLIGSAP